MTQDSTRPHLFRLVLLGLIGLVLWRIGFGLIKLLVDDDDFSNNRIGGIRVVAFGQDGRTLATANYNKTIEIWDVANFRVLRTLRGFDGVLLIPDGHILTWGDGQKTTMWDLASGAPSGTLGADGVIAFSPNNRILLDQSLRLWDIGSGQLLRTLGGPEDVYAAFSPDGKSLAEGGVGDSHKVWLSNVSDGKLLRVFERPCGQKRTKCRVRAVSFSPDGRTIASADSDDNEVDLWDVATGRLLQELPMGIWVNAIAFSADGRTLGVTQGAFVRGQWEDTGSAEGSVTLWDVASGKLLHKRAFGAFCIAFSPDGHTVAVGAAPYTVQLLDSRSGQTLRTLRGDAYWRRFKDDLKARLL